MGLEQNSLGMKKGPTEGLIQPVALASNWKID